MPRCSLMLLIVLVLSCAAAAQSDHIEVFGGYSYMDPDYSLVTPNSTNGWNASATLQGRSLVRLGGGRLRLLP
ncbi:MAG TPA: hypothetical protein VMX38_12885 [Verrucomicrobiae bacterium]|nr:hypothetical protein [Verrucomicrobiae bacterium]